ncbi:MAG TPA: hypothetical protein VGA99_04170 [bacterium]
MKTIVINSVTRIEGHAKITFAKPVMPRVLLAGIHFGQRQMDSR